jgi:predicted acylesterase/phospholipase RssA
VSSSHRKIRRILAIDGGGVRGIIPARLLAALESRSGIPIADQFDLISGTSTGGLIALALGLRISAADVTEMYKDLGANVFGKARIISALSPKYRLAQLAGVLGPKFNGKKLGDSVTRLVVPAYDVANKSLYVYKTAHHPRLKVDYRESMLRVACSTAAAPSYFEAYSEDGVALVDGGVWANNPAGVAVVEACSLLGWGGDDIRILSIGCGRSPFDFPRSGGWLSVAVRITGFFQLKAPPIMQLIMKGQSDSALGTARLLTNHSRQNPKVFRYEPDPMKIGDTKLNDYKAIPMLEGLGNELAATAIDEVAAAFAIGRCEPFTAVYQLEGSDDLPQRAQRVPI